MRTNEATVGVDIDNPAHRHGLTPDKRSQTVIDVLFLTGFGLLVSTWTVLMSNGAARKITSAAAADTFISRQTGRLTFFMAALGFTEETEEKDDFKGHKQNSRLRQTSLRV